MVHQYIIGGMSCNGCRKKVEERLNGIPGIQATVSLDPPRAVIEMKEHIADAALQEALSEAGAYTIAMKHGNEHIHPAHAAHSPVKHKKYEPGNGIYYCPMYCEGDKTYDKPGHCPVCGMDLVE